MPNVPNLHRRKRKNPSSLFHLTFTLNRIIVNDMKKYILYFGLFIICFSLSYWATNRYLNPIPKIIHYVWLGKGPMPKDALRALASWEKYAPDYKVMRWDETNCPFETSLYAHKTYVDKKYAFTSDFCRYYALYHHGGLYLDTDQELTKPLDSFFIRDAPLVLTYEHNNSIASSFIAMKKNHPLARQILDYFMSSQTQYINGPQITTDSLLKIYPNFALNGLFLSTAEMTVYPANETTFNFGGPENFAIHRYDASSTSLKKGSYHFVFSKTFLNQHAICVVNGENNDFLIPIRDSFAYLRSNTKVGRLCTQTDDAICIEFTPNQPVFLKKCPSKE